MTRKLTRRLLFFWLASFAFTLTVRAERRAGIASLILDNENRVWLKVETELFVLKPETIEPLSRRGQTTTQHLKPGSINQLKIEEAGRLPANPGELFEFAGADDPTQWARGLYETSDGHVWVTSEKELFEYDGRVFHRYSSSQPTMYQMAENAAGNLWIGGQAGLVRRDRKGLTSRGESDGLNSTRLFSINESQDSALYVSNGDFSHCSVVFWRALILQPLLGKMNNTQIRSIIFFARFVNVY